MSEVPLARLFEIATRRRPIHSNPEVILPVQPDRPIAPEALFRADDPPAPGDGVRRRILELGSGWGEFLVDWLQQHPADDYVAFEIKSDRIRRTIKRVRKLEAPHLRVVPVNFAWFLEEILPPAAFDWIIVNFPDPWPKRRHWKHRLVQPDFPERMAPLLRPGGQIHLATDYGPYARKMIQIFRRAADFEAVFPDSDFLRRRPADVPVTRFEQITGESEGRTPYFTRWRLRSGRPA
ncbi:MAG: tRNA (guanine-N7)-methyltransferase [bacterium]|nr:tRNA (guanine-N7)-methyltransferase [bacterium]